ncbi:MAG TPA: DEAD/DEAH box helicase [Anaerolineales bacterium]|nr:DEAD/DEAH box helicase [Anaerolineales bacterium]
MSFESFSLDARVRAGIQSAGYTQPTPIQLQSIPPILAGRDLLGIAQTGTGKTAAFMLPILQRLLAHPGRGVRALILAPTRELAEQIHQAARVYGKRTGVRSAAIYGGVGKKPQLDALRRGADIVVACPGRLLDLAGERSLDLSKVEVLVLDEADRMCDMGFLPDIKRILKLVPTQRQTLFFSATMPDEIRLLADGILHDPVTVQIGLTAPPKSISHALYPVSGGLKKSLLLAMLKRRTGGRALIFTRTKHRARTLARDLDKQGYRVEALQGNMTQNRRQAAIDGFRGNRYDILVATDVASRGIDVAGIAHVINYDVPDTADAYTHRVGRTGRVDQTGEALTLAQPEDEPIVRQIERVLGQPIERRRLEQFNYGDFNPESRPNNGHGPTASRRSSNGNGHRPGAARPRAGSGRPSGNRPGRSRLPRR